MTTTLEQTTFHCARCGQDKPILPIGGTGYGERDGAKVCYACCGELDRAEMIETGRATLYLAKVDFSPLSMGCDRSGHRVSNWPGTLAFFCHVRKSRHNMAGNRYDVWFRGPDGKQWHGVQYGDNTQICRCRRTKS